jgi:hypothetical protein
MLSLFEVSQRTRLTQTSTHPANFLKIRRQHQISIEDEPGYFGLERTQSDEGRSRADEGVYIPRDTFLALTCLARERLTR